MGTTQDTGNQMHKINPALKSLSKEVTSLYEDPKNARRHGQADLSVIAKSLDEHGQQKPIIATTEGKVIAGNGTLSAARDILKWTHIAVVVYDNEDKAKQAAFAIVDNRSAELSSWDFDELAKAIAAIPDNIIPDLGFTDKELKAISGSSELPASLGGEPAVRHVEFNASSKSTTGEVTDLGEAKQKCPKCHFEFDG